MAQVTDLRDARGIVEVYLDGVRFVKIRKKHFEIKPLSAGDEIAPEEYLNLVASVQFADAYEAALTSLDFSARTGGEIEKSLKARGYVAPAARAVVEKLTEAHLIDDAQYASRLTENAAKKGVGIFSVRRKLMAKGHCGRGRGAGAFEPGRRAAGKGRAGGSREDPAQI